MKKWKMRMIFFLTLAWAVSGTVSYAEEEILSFAEKGILPLEREETNLCVEDAISDYAGKFDLSRAGEIDPSYAKELNASYDGEGNLYDAVFLLMIYSRETEEAVGLYSCFAVEQNGRSWIVTARDAAEIDYENYDAMLVMNEQEMRNVVAIEAGEHAAQLYAAEPVEAQTFGLVGQAPDGSAVAGLYCLGEFQEDGKFSQGLAVIRSYQEKNGSYVPTDSDIPEINMVWSGVPILETENSDVCGIGRYENGEYLFQDLNDIQLYEEVSIQNWGKLGEESEGDPDGQDENPGSSGSNSEERSGGSGEQGEGSGSGSGEQGEGSGGASGGQEKAGENGGEAEQGKSAEQILQEHWLKKSDYYIIGALAVIAVIAGIFVVIRKKAGRNSRQNDNANPAGRYQNNNNANPAGGYQHNPNGNLPLNNAGYPGGAVPGMGNPSYTLRCIAGPAAGQSTALQGSIYIGRDSSRCGFAFSEGTKGVSRLHCMVKVQDGTIVLKDLNSTYGTFLKNGVRLQSGVEYHVEAGTEFYLANSNIILRIEKGGY